MVTGTLKKIRWMKRMVMNERTNERTTDRPTDRPTRSAKVSYQTNPPCDPVLLDLGNRFID